MLEMQPRGSSEESSCPKRLWVMLSLADDEAGDSAGTSGQQQGEMSLLVRAHLAHCRSCRDMADGVLGVHAALVDLSKKSPTDKQLQTMLDQGLAAARKVDAGECAAPDDFEAPVGWRARWANWLLNPRPRRFGASPRRIPLGQAVAAGFLFALLGGGYVAYRGMDVSSSAQKPTPEVTAARPWIQIPTLQELGVHEQLSVWETTARSPFEKIQGWKGPVRRWDDMNLGMEWGHAEVVAAPETGDSDRNPADEQAGATVAARRISSPGTGESPVNGHGAADSWTATIVESAHTIKSPSKPNGTVDNPPSVVLSKGSKDNR